MAVVIVVDVDVVTGEIMKEESEGKLFMKFVVIAELPKTFHFLSPSLTLSSSCQHNNNSTLSSPLILSPSLLPLPHLLILKTYALILNAQSKELLNFFFFTRDMRKYTYPPIYTIFKITD